VITKFFGEILIALEKSAVKPSAVKPNYAFYAQYGFEGLKALKNVVDMYKKSGFIVILDVKRGDISTSSQAYARESFLFWGVDAVTISPYMGADSVMPFIDWCKKGKGVYVLNRTTNKGAADIQNIVACGTPIYRKVSEKILEWHVPGLGAVVGATCPDEFEEISNFFVNSKKFVPLLIPGVGAQGGAVSDVTRLLKKTNNHLWLHRINSSSGITYAYEAQETDDFAGAALREIERMNKECGAIFNW
ncbi:MAG: orotidine-5'-phosphate decarboxylase, partial [Candidatus Bathyarchaeia archaeon]